MDIYTRSCMLRSCRSTLCVCRCVCLSSLLRFVLFRVVVIYRCMHVYVWICVQRTKLNKQDGERYLDTDRRHTFGTAKRKAKINCAASFCIHVHVKSRKHFTSSALCFFWYSFVHSDKVCPPRPLMQEACNLIYCWFAFCNVQDINEFRCKGVRPPFGGRKMHCVCVANIAGKRNRKI